MRAVAALALVALAACGSSRTEVQPAPEPGAARPADEVAPEAPEPAPDPIGPAADAPAPDPACVEACVEESQARAMPLDLIRGDCERECGARAAEAEETEAGD